MIAPDFSGITEKYHNTVIPEFGILAIMILVAPMIGIIFFTRSKFQYSFH